ncbi:CHAT domain-containing protein [Streptomyces sp. VRA16 Mangrove soil]|uniref:CHAT domain-containing protein n=1 Tax=Streptomyces sp. VRA16 Mangrove soil TaxID=2817434 RepID=UPI001A9F8620|nr:CHAT domain-containing protein [Streptomyces sp. VRA16 Mangrove soil]MBO1336876.1 CHAT domain-containing protein [Streptomyces sp. VRA16 Mangrove soil]
MTTVDFPSADRLPVPWSQGSGPADVDALISELAAYPASRPAHQDLLEALRCARTRWGRHAPFAGDGAAEFAREVLEIAVEWRMPAVERWATAWLFACGEPFLRLRWSSRSRDGRFRRDGHAAGRVSAVAGAADAVVVGTESGLVQRWTSAGDLHTVGRLEKEPGHGPTGAVAVRGEGVVAGGPHGELVTEGLDAPPPPPEQRAMITAAALGPHGGVACGDELGRVLLYRPATGRWADLSRPAAAQGRVESLAFRDDGALCAAWRRGTAAERRTGAEPGGTDGWVLRHPPAPDLRAVAWDPSGTWLATVTAAGQVRVVGQRALDWSHPGAHGLVWSTDGRLASVGRTDVRIGLPGAGPAVDTIVTDAPVGQAALLGTRYLITTHGAEVVQWDLAAYGSERPHPDTLAPLVGDNTITAIATAQEGWTAVGTARGEIRIHSGRGAVEARARLHPAGHVYHLVPCDEGWLIAGHFGAYWWTPEPGADAGPRRLSTSLCTAVAAWKPFRIYAEGDQVVIAHGKQRKILRLGRTGDEHPGGNVADLRVSRDGTLAALFDSGALLLHDLTDDSSRASTAAAGSRLIGFGENGPLLREPTSCVAEFTATGRQKVARLPSAAGETASLGGHGFVVADPQRGLVLGRNSFRQLTAPSRVDHLAVAGRRIAVAGEGRVLGYEVAQPDGAGTGVLRIGITTEHDGCTFQLPDGGQVRVNSGVLDALRVTKPRTLGELSRAVTTAGTVGEALGQAGLDLFVDAARGAFPDRPVRIELAIGTGADDLAWELLHDPNAALGWFGRPRVTITRVVTPDSCSAVRPRAEADGKPALLVVRGKHQVTPMGTDLLANVDDAYDRMWRRTRRSHVRLVEPHPVSVLTQPQLKNTLRDHVDLLHLWAHCDQENVEFGPGGRLTTEAVATCITGAAPRLVVLIGCRSGALGRLLVERGVPCVVAMRAEVYSRTVQPLVEDFTALVLEGT